MSRVYNHKKSPLPSHVQSMKLNNQTLFHQKDSLLPSVCDLRNLFKSYNISALDQGQLGSCVANAFSNAFKFLLNVEAVVVYQPSRLYLYYISRVFIDGQQQSADSGTLLSSLVEAVNQYGSLSESLFPYDVNAFQTPPTKSQFSSAFTHNKINYVSVEQNLNSIKQLLCNKNVIACGISVYQSFEDASNGQIPMPSSTDTLLGGHCILIVGYTATSWIFLNSWGSSWGVLGYGFLPLQYLLSADLTSELYCVTFME
jgi:C1A family cysteine protease